MTDVPIASAATAYDDPRTGRTVLLEYNQGLWFGDKLENSLINPNQCRLHGISLCDDPHDPHRPLGIRDPETETEIPMRFGSCIVYVETRAPTIEEIRTLPRVIMTSDEPWDPASVGTAPISREAEERIKMIASVRIDQRVVKASTPREPQLQMDEPTYNILMASCSAVYSEKTMAQCLVSSVKIASHHEDWDELLTRDGTAIRSGWVSGIEGGRNALALEASTRDGTAI
jgi:hypothetical protein